MKMVGSVPFFLVARDETELSQVSPIVSPKRYRIHIFIRWNLSQNWLDMERLQTKETR
jgi:hypothetical protein